MAFNPDIIQSINGFSSEHYLLALFARWDNNQTRPEKQHASLRLAAVLAGGNY